MKKECGRIALLSDVVEKTVLNYNNYLLVDTFSNTIITVKFNQYFNVVIKQINNRNSIEHSFNRDELNNYLLNYLSKYSLTILRKFFIVDLENKNKLSLIDKKEL